MFYGRIHLNTGDVKNDLTISELHHHLRLKTDAYLLHNIYEVLLRAIYHYIHYFFFPEMFHLCDGVTIMVTPTNILNHTAFTFTHIRPTIDVILNTHLT